jgi:hypothetical protein
MTAMACHLGVLPTGLATSTTEFEDDVDGGPPGGPYRWVQQRPPPNLKMTSMAAPSVAMRAGLALSMTEFEDHIDGGPP